MRKTSHKIKKIIENEKLKKDKYRENTNGSIVKIMNIGSIEDKPMVMRSIKINRGAEIKRMHAEIINKTCTL